MNLEKVHIRNFKCIEELTLDLSSINFIVGGNNSGKSSVLQAIHVAVTLAQVSAEMGSKIIPENQLKYSPTGEFQDLGHNGPLGNKSSSNRILVQFIGKDDRDDNAEYTVNIYKAQNSGAGIDRGGKYHGFGAQILRINPPFSIYVPGLSGVPHFEEFKSEAVVVRKIAGGEANSVLRNILYLLKCEGKINELIEYLDTLFSGIKLTVNFDSKKDHYIDVKASIGGGNELPIDLIGTGVLQAVQLFSYIILFSPKVLLIDEPDSHLHPSNQQLILESLNKLAKQSGTSIILSTHSRHLINAIPDDANIIWLQNGDIIDSGNIDKLKLLNDLGALDQSDQFDKPLIILTEDEDKSIMKKILKQNGYSLDDIGIASYNGVSNYNAAIQIAKELKGKDQNIIIHRDRDFLTEDEASDWKDIVKRYGLIPFVTEFSDLEMYYLSNNHLSNISGKKLGEIETLTESILSENNDKIRKTYRDIRRNHNRSKMYQDGGAPDTKLLCPEDKPVNISHVKGKDFLSWIRVQLLDKTGSRIEPLQNHDNSNIALDLKAIIDSAMGY